MGEKIPTRLLAPVESLTPFVLRIGSLIENLRKSGKKEQVTITIDNEHIHCPEIDNESIPPKPSDLSAEVLKICQTLNPWQRKVSGSLIVFISPEGDIECEKRIRFIP